MNPRDKHEATEQAYKHESLMDELDTDNPSILNSVEDLPESFDNDLMCEGLYFLDDRNMFGEEF